MPNRDRRTDKIKKLAGVGFGYSPLSNEEYAKQTFSEKIPPTTPTPEEQMPASPAGKAAAELKKSKILEPESILETLKKAQRLGEKEYAKGTEERKAYEENISGLRQKVQDLSSQWKSKGERIDLAQVGEQLANALTQLGAGIQSQNTGIDVVSDLKLANTDFDAKRGNLQREIGTKMAGVEKEISSQERGIKDSSEASERRRRESINNYIKLYADQQRELQAQARKLQREAEDDSKAQEKLIKQRQKIQGALSKASSELNNYTDEEGKGTSSWAEIPPATRTRIQEAVNSSGVTSWEQIEARSLAKAEAQNWFQDAELSDKNVTPFLLEEVQQVLSQANEVYEAAPTVGKIRVRNPQGQVGEIPASQLEEALANGFQKVD